MLHDIKNGILKKGAICHFIHFQLFIVNRLLFDAFLLSFDNMKA